MNTISPILRKINSLLGKEAESLLSYKCTKVRKNDIYITNKNVIEDIFINSDRNLRTLNSLSTLFSKGRLANTGYLSILPVDQGIEHSAGASFSPNPIYFDPENIIKLAIESGCNAVTSSYGVLGLLARKYTHKIPFILKMNHNELLSYPNSYHQIFFSHVKQAYDMGCIGVGATIYFGSSTSKEEIEQVSKAFHFAHELGLATILWCYLRNSAFTTKDYDYHSAADLSGQANHLGVTLGADIIKQKMPTCNRGFTKLDYGKTSEKVYTELSSDHPIDLCRYQVLNCYNGKIGLINSGGPSGENDVEDVLKTAIINKRAGGMGLIAGRKAFQRPFKEGVELLNMIQDIYLDETITIA